jgi:L-alanine-DL-glutamate epimerase-like enolase superfamily enzyme
MRIVRVETWRESLALARPYVIATRRIEAVELFFVQLVSDGAPSGLGAASPAELVTGETPAACAAALDADRLAWLRGQDPRHLGALCRTAADELGPTPAARAAVDMALHDLLGRCLGVPVVDFLGRRSEPLPTSITIGIKSAAETLEEASEYLGRGFRCLKVKIGHDLAADVERLSRLRESVGPSIAIRVDANQGYDLEQTARFAALVARLDLELIEQPLPAAALGELRRLPPALRETVAADESLLGEVDALRLVEPPAACGIFNIKLMKCGGISPALSIAGIGAWTGRRLMWGCMDESVVGIAAALHAAHACPATRFLDLDGSFDLARDAARGGFRLQDGRLQILDRPGLGVERG